MRGLTHVLRSWSLWSSASTNRRVLSATLLIAGATAAVKGVAMLREVVVAARFGTGDAMDAFLLAMLLPTFLMNLVGNAMKAALIPTFLRVRRNSGEDAARRLLSNAAAASLGLLVPLTAFMLLTTGWTLPLLGSGFGGPKLALTRALLLLLSPIVLLRGLGMLWAAVLNASERFTLVAAAPALVPLVTIAFLLGGGEAIRIDALVLGVVAGTLCETAVLGAALRRRGIPLVPRWSGFRPEVRTVAKQFLPMLSGGLILSSTTIVDVAMAASLGAGSVAILGYGERLLAVPLGLGATALGTAVFPYLSRMVADGDRAGVGDLVRRLQRLVFRVTIPLAALLFAGSTLVVRLVYERGSFTAADTEAVGLVLALLALHIPFYIAGRLVVRLLSAMLANHILLFGNIVSVVLNVALNLLFVRWIGVAGIALSTSIVYIVSFLLLSLYARRRLR